MTQTLFPLDLVPQSEIDQRITRMRQALAGSGLDGVLLTHRPDIYYFTGTAQESWVWISQDHDPLVFVKRYLPRALAETPLKEVIPVDSVTRIPELIQSAQGRLPTDLGLAFDLVPVRDFRFFEQLFAGSRFGDASPLIMGIRAIKSQWEIQRMDLAAKVSARTFAWTAQHLEPGMTETDLAGQMEAFARTQGHSGKIQMRHYRSEGFSFHIMSGRSGGIAGALDSPVCGTGTCTAYPFGAGPSRIQPDEPVLIDFATMVKGYHMDESRIFCAGQMPEKASAACDAARDLLFFIKEAMQPGAVIKEIFDQSCARAGKTGLGSAYLGLPELKSRFVGHGIGLELVESPILAAGRTEVLAPGMVFAVEPKFIFRDKFAAGIESVILVTENGGRFITQTPHEVFLV